MIGVHLYLLSFSNVYLSRQENFFVVADEPLSALDVSVQAQVISLLFKLREEFHLSYLFISHDLSVVEYISDRIAVMYLGTIVEMAPRDQLFDSPRHPYTVAILSAAPIPQVQKKSQRIILKGDIPSPLRTPAGCRFHTRCLKVMEVCSQTAEVERPERRAFRSLPSLLKKDRDHLGSQRKYL